MTRTSDEGDVTFPAIYAKRGEFTAVNAEQSVVYHRLLSGPTDTDDEEDNSPVSNTIITRTYGMRAVAIFPLELYGADDQYQEDKVIRNLAGQLKHRQIKTLKKALSLIELSVQPGDSSRGVEAWEDEFSGIDYVPKVRIVAVDYEITFRGFEDCITAAGCDDAAIDVIQAIKDEYCTDSCDPASITTNGDSPALEVASGATQDIAVHDTASADVGSRSGATVTIADTTVTVNSSAYGTTVAESTLNVQVVDGSDSAVGSLSGGKWVVPDVYFVDILADENETELVFTVYFKDSGTRTVSAQFLTNGTIDSGGVVVNSDPGVNTFVGVSLSDGDVITLTYTASGGDFLVELEF